MIRRRMHNFALRSALIFTLTPALRADEIMLGRIPLSGVTVRGIDNCQVLYTLSGALSNRPIDRVVLHLDAMPALERAETAAAEQRLDEAMALLDEAMRQASEPWQKSWIHYRRLRLLNDAGLYTRACGAWATLLITSLDPCWVDTMPTCEPDRPDEATAEAALVQLRKALEVSQANAVARDMVDLAIRTISNIELVEEDAAPVAPAPDASESERGGEVEAPAEVTPAAPRTIADDIDDLIKAGNARDARREIEKWVADTKKYPLDRLLHQYGRVLAADKQSKDAAVRFMQCAILYPDSPHAAASLFETARLYAGPLGDVATARRLLDRAQATAIATNQGEVLESVRTALAELGNRR